VSCAGLFIGSHLGDFPGVWLHVDMASPVYLVSSLDILWINIKGVIPSYMILDVLCMMYSKSNRYNQNRLGVLLVCENYLNSLSVCNVLYLFIYMIENKIK